MLLATPAYARAGKGRSICGVVVGGGVGDESEVGEVGGAGEVLPVGGVGGDGVADVGGAALEGGGWVAVDRYWRGDVKDLVVVVGGAVEQADEDGGAGVAGEGDDAGQE